MSVPALLEQLRQLHNDLRTISRHDPEQEVTGLALSLMDAVLSEAKQLLPRNSGLATQIVDMISVEQIESGDGIRAVDASIVVGQLLAASTTLIAEQSAREAEAVAADKAFLSEYLDVLPPDGPAVRHLRYHDFSRRYEDADARPLWRYYDEWTGPSQRFQSPRLAPLDVAFREALGELYDHNVHHVFTCDDGSRRIYPDHSLDWENPENKFVFDALRRGNDLLRTTYARYEELIHVTTLALP